MSCQKSSTLDVGLVIEYVSGPTDLKNQNLPAQTARAEKTSTCYNILQVLNKFYNYLRHNKYQIIRFFFLELKVMDKMIYQGQ